MYVRNTDTATLNQLKKELGLPEFEPAGDLSAGLDVTKAIEDAVAEGGDKRGVNGVGFTKAEGLNGSDKTYGATYYNTGYNNN